MENKYTNKNGFTILEVIVALAISITVIGAVYLLQDFLFSQERFAMTSFLTTDEANRNIEILVKHIRNTHYADNGAYPLEITADYELAFYTDYDEDGQVERLRYFVDQGNLRLGIIEPTTYPVNYPSANETITTVASGIKNSTPLFYYYNRDWPTDTVNNPLMGVTRQLNTRLIEIQLLMNSNDQDLKTDYQIRANAQIRMLKDNL